MRRSGYLLSACFGFVLSASAQTGAGRIQGVIKDSSSAVVAKCAVSAVHLATGREYKTSSNELGLFVFPPLQPGAHLLTASAEGFQVWQGTVDLQVGQTAEINPTLTLGTTSAQVTVMGNVTPLVTTDSPVLGNVVQRERLEQLPLNGRYLQTLVFQTTPGVDYNPSNPTVYGIRYGMEFLQDGAVLTNRTLGGISTRPPGLDTVEELRVETNSSSAKFAAPATTVLSTRAGTNMFHGSLFETARNNSIGVARARQDFYTKPPQLIRNEFGASAGGPVFLPKIYNGKDRTFFFFAWEAYRYAYSSTAATTMHTMAMRQGDFSGLVDGAGRRYMLYDAWSTNTTTYSRNPFPNNQIPLAKESPMAKYLLDVTPVPTLPDVNPLIGINYMGLVPLSSRNSTETLRIDHRITDHDQVFVRYSHGQVLNTGLRSVLPTTDGLLNITKYPVYDDGAALSWTHSFSPTFFSETLLSGTQEDFVVGKGSSNAEFLVNKLGVPNPFNNGYGAIVVRKTGFDIDYREQEYEANLNRIFVWDQNFTKIHGRHQIQFGGRIRHERLHVLGAQPRLTNSFQNSFGTSLYDPASGSSLAAVPYTGHDSANFFLGLANSYDTILFRPWYHMTADTFVGYVQDNIKVTPQFTLNVGLRWEFYPAFKEDHNLLTGFNLKTKSVITGATLQELYALGASSPEVVQDYLDIGAKFTSAREEGLPPSLLHSNPWDFNPRIGFAYRAGSGTRALVLRGGYGLYGFAPNLRSFTDNMRRDVPMYSVRQHYFNDAAYSPDGMRNYLLRSVPTVIAGQNSRDILKSRLTGDALRGSFPITFFDPDQPTMRAHEWNFTLERELWRDTVVRTGYVGTHGAKLEQYQSINEVPTDYVWFASTGLAKPANNVDQRPFDHTTYGTLNWYQRRGWSNANAVRLEAERRYSNGYGFQFFYILTNAFKSRSSDVNADIIYDAANYLPGAVPADVDARTRFLYYRRDTDVPKHRLNWNWVVDLPFGRGKKLLGNSGSVLNRVVGGWQIAGLGSYRSNYFSMPASYWGATNPVQIYGTKYPIEDCRSGVCYQGYLWYNGYIPANRINSHGANGKPNGVMGVPADYKPSAQPLWPTPADGGLTDPNRSLFETNTVYVPLKNGALQKTSLDTNLNWYRNQYFAGPWSFGLDASLFKAIPITETVFLRFNADFFNVLNNPGLGQPGSDGIISKLTSANTPRTMQLTLRLTW